MMQWSIFVSFVCDIKDILQCYYLLPINTIVIVIPLHIIYYIVLAYTYNLHEYIILYYTRYVMYGNYDFNPVTI